MCVCVCARARACWISHSTGCGCRHDTSGSNFMTNNRKFHSLFIHIALAAMVFMIPCSHSPLQRPKALAMWSRNIT